VGGGNENRSQKAEGRRQKGTTYHAPRTTHTHHQPPEEKKKDTHTQQNPNPSSSVLSNLKPEVGFNRQSLMKKLISTTRVPTQKKREREREYEILINIGTYELKRAASIEASDYGGRIHDEPRESIGVTAVIRRKIPGRSWRNIFTDRHWAGRRRKLRVRHSGLDYILNIRTSS
jgi:hypothetical protein